MNKENNGRRFSFIIFRICGFGAGYLTPGASDEVSASGGAAALDVSAALWWVRRNIAAFGGDPRRLTLVGHSAGAALVNVMLMLPLTKGTLDTGYLSY